VERRTGFNRAASAVLVAVKGAGGAVAIRRLDVHLHRRNFDLGLLGRRAIVLVPVLGTMMVSVLGLAMFAMLAVVCVRFAVLSM